MDKILQLLTSNEKCEPSRIALSNNNNATLDYYNDDYNDNFDDYNEPIPPDDEYVIEGIDITEQVLNEELYGTLNIAFKDFETITDTDDIASAKLANYDMDDVFITDSKGKVTIHEERFCEVFSSVNDIISVNGQLYNVDGAVTEMKAMQLIQSSIAPHVLTNLHARTTSIYKALVVHCSKDKLKAEPYKIPIQNGTVYVSANQILCKADKEHTPYRLNVTLTNEPMANMPMFNMWLNDLFVTEDIPVVQEMLGYLCLPITKAQKAFFILGDGGNGKSVLGYLLEVMFGNSFSPAKVHALEGNKFMLSELENKLVAYDDDLDNESLKKTDVFKNLVTARGEVKVEKKFVQPYSIIPYARIVACGNFRLTAMFDNTEGFFRRLLPIITKRKKEGRVDIPNLHELIGKEKNVIFKWALIGLQRLMQNNYKFSISERTITELKSIRADSINILSFLNDDTERGDKDDFIASRRLLEAYNSWCYENASEPMTERRFFNWLGAESYKLGVESTVTRIKGKIIKGYSGLKLTVDRNPYF